MKNAPPDAPADKSSLPSHVPSTEVPAWPAVGPGWKNWQLVAAVVAAFVVGGVGVIVSRPAIPTPAPPPATKASTSSPASAGTRELSTPAPVVAPYRGPKWTRTRQSGWATDGSRTVSFELEAENAIGVWMKRVRPILAVRCLGKQTEVFVVTDSASSIEPIADQHTVRISFDDQGEIAERWLDSAAHRELFAPDGLAFAHRLAGVEKMRFGFTPFNSSPVVVDFDVRGFAAGPLDAVAKTCRWSGQAAEKRSLKEDAKGTKSKVRT